MWGRKKVWLDEQSSFNVYKTDGPAKPLSILPSPRIPTLPVFTVSSESSLLYIEDENLHLKQDRNDAHQSAFMK